MTNYHNGLQRDYSEPETVQTHRNNEDDDVKEGSNSDEDAMDKTNGQRCRRRQSQMKLADDGKRSVETTPKTY